VKRNGGKMKPDPDEENEFSSSESLESVDKDVIDFLRNIGIHVKVRRVVKGGTMSSHFAATRNVMFEHSFEERKAIEYLNNFINSPCIYHDPHKLCMYAIDILGDNKILPLFKEYCPKLNSAEKADHAPLVSRIEELVPARTVIAAVLRERISPMLLKRLEQVSMGKITELEKSWPASKMHSG
jgi:hypothetical protein